MNRNIWGIALIGALSLVACGGDGTDPGGAGDGSGGNAVEPQWLTVEVIVVADTIDVSDALVSVRQDGNWDAPVRYADYQANPSRYDVNDSKFQGVAAKIEAPGLFSEPTDFVNGEAIKASGDTYVAHVVVARDLRGANWTCSKTSYYSGVPQPTETKTAVEVDVRLDIEEPFAEHYVGGVHAFTMTEFLIVGDRIFGAYTVNGQEVVASGSVSSPNTFDYEKTFNGTDSMKFHCGR